MGGLGSGGHAAVGRKPREPQIPSDAPLPVVEPPGRITAEERQVWDELAPHALRERTLVPATGQRFARLCTQIVLERKMLAQIDADGLTETKVSLQMDDKGGGLQTVEKKAHTLLSKLISIGQRIDAGMTAFRIAPTGRAIATTVQEKPKSALEQLQARNLRAV